MKLTKHARKQAQRRGIATDAIDLILSYGEDTNAGHGCRLLRIPRRELPFVGSECPPMLWRRYRDRLRRMATVVSGEDQKIVTVMHRKKPIWKKIW